MDDGMKRIEYYRLLVKAFKDDYTEYEEHVDLCATVLEEMRDKYGDDIPYDEFLISIGRSPALHDAVDADCGDAMADGASGAELDIWKDLGTRIRQKIGEDEFQGMLFATMFDHVDVMDAFNLDEPFLKDLGIRHWVWDDYRNKRV